MSQRQGLVRRAVGRVVRARERHRVRPVCGRERVISWVVVMLAGFMIATSATASRGTDLRPTRNDNLIDLVQAQAERNRELTRRAGQLRTEVDDLSRQSVMDPATKKQLDKSSAEAGLTPVKGPAVRVTLTDAPLDVQPPGVDDDLLVVHQQDIQMVANVLWAAGAEAMMIQDQRVTSITGIKCVGNTVVLRGVPYAPPYVITAIGDPDALSAALDNSPEVAVYQEYVEAYRLGWAQERLAEVTLPGYSGALDIRTSSATDKP